jgi:uncharacterized damage-inducible protein DinB
MIRTISDFKEDWEFEKESTLKIFNSLTDDSLTQKVTPEGRSLGNLAWHLTMSVNEMINRTGLDIGEIDPSRKNSPHITDLIGEYARVSNLLAKQVEEKWNDQSLTEEVNMYGEMWKKGKVLSSLIGHQAHHRAQMTVLMRQAGLKVPGIYGPSKEEWAAFGMPPQE